MWDGGFTEYIHDWWNLMDFAMNSLYLATISLKIVAYVKVKMAAAVMRPCVIRSPLTFEAAAPHRRRTSSSDAVVRRIC